MSHQNSLSEGVIEVGIAVSNKATITGAGVGVVGWAAQVNWLGICGVLIAALGFAVNFYFQRRRDQREARESEARIAALRERCELP